jgi:CBS domain-containing protein
MTNRVEFLKTVEPFNLLPEHILEEVAGQLQEIKYSKETVIYQQEITKLRGIDIIIEGEYESFFYDSSQNKRLLEHYTTGHCFGGISVLVNRKQSLRTVIAKKGTKIYFLHRRDFRSLCKTYDDFFQHFTSEFGRMMLNDEFAHFFKRPATFEESYIASEQLYSRKMESIEYRDIVACRDDTPIYQAAQLMAQHKISCIFVRNQTGDIVGYVTDITLRDNVVAQLMDAHKPVQDVMDNPIISINTEAYVYEAILMMFRTKTRYLLIKKEDAYVGFISRTKLLSEQAQSPLVFIQSVKLSLSVGELKRKWEEVPQMATQLLGRGVHAEIVNQVITTVADTIAIKVIESVIAEMGTPPAKFVFMVLGSEGRKEQTFKTDQDNAIIYEDKANEHREEVRTYFLEFAKHVSDKLNHIGFVYCEGGFMAMNPEWTHSLSYWKRNYTTWMAESVPESVIKFSTFFDCRYLYGDETIITELKEFLDAELQRPMEKLFFHMAKNALQYEPPLTFFKKIRTFTKDSQEVFDIKKAMTPIVDLARVYALKNRIFDVNTGERLKALKDKGIFTQVAYQELIQSYYFLMGMRLRRQATQIIHDKMAPNNYIDPETLTKIERVTLKEIFKTIEGFQARIRMEFTGNLLG